MIDIRVNNFDVYKAEEELKKCPTIIKTYVKLLKEAYKRQQELTGLAIKKLREK
jgi:hypothetical protein